MASSKHLMLSDFIKSVHKNLRETSKEIGSEQAWGKHCSDEENLKKYASAMRELACQYWEPNIDAGTMSRILWTFRLCSDYFNNDINKFRYKEKEILLKINPTSSVPPSSYNHYDLNKLKLLDVGSCYNPFGKFEEFEVTAIDIAPATEEVFQCDFLSAKIGDKLTVIENEICELPERYFNIVVFSLLLEYLPTPKQRLVCCEKAYDLLSDEGLLIVITPDSNHAGANAKFMKSWRYVLAKLGFSRIKYEKLPHVHCMAFRKTISKAVACRWSELHSDKGLFEEIHIPQDFNKSDEKLSSSKDVCKTSDCNIDFNELSGTDVFQ